MTTAPTTLDDYENDAEPTVNNNLNIKIESSDDLFWYDHVAQRLNNALDRINPDNNEYTAMGQNAGWNNTSGTAAVTLEDGHDIFETFTPNGMWSMEIEGTEDAIVLTLSHHDSPMGETHRIYAADE